MRLRLVRAFSVERYEAQESFAPHPFHVPIECFAQESFAPHPLDLRAQRLRRYKGIGACNNLLYIVVHVSSAHTHKQKERERARDGV